MVTFPTLLLFGYAPLVANVSNNIGLVAGEIPGTFGYRRELNWNKAILKKFRRYPFSVRSSERCSCWCCRRMRSRPSSPYS